MTILTQISEQLQKGAHDQVGELTRTAIAEGLPPATILDDGLKVVRENLASGFGVHLAEGTDRVVELIGGDGHGQQADRQTQGRQTFDPVLRRLHLGPGNRQDQRGATFAPAAGTLHRRTVQS